MSRVAVVLAAWLLLLVPAAAQERLTEQGQFRQMFDEQLTAMVNEIVDDSSARVVRIGELWVDHLSPSGGDAATAKVTRRFSGGEGQYLVMGLCDEDCTDIDLHLWDRDENEAVLSDTEEDAQPLLLSGGFEDSLTDGKEYEIEIRMFDCGGGAEYCYFAVGIYRFEEN